MQTTTDVQSQTIAVEAKLNPDDKYMIVSIWEIMRMLMHYSDAEDSSPKWKENLERFNFTFNSMKTRGYPVPESRRKKRSMMPKT